MKKGIKNIKKVLALLLIIIFSIENFAAIVADNDGSAFVTKAEFEALKEDFESQIDVYNDSIDGKIDGAIAAYLAGINLQKAQSLNTILKDWDKVTMRNTELKNTYGLPGTMLSLSYYGSGHHNIWNQYPSAYGLAIVGSNAAQKAKLKAVTLKEGKEENYNDLTKNKFFWAGLITDYEEKIAMSKLGYNNSQDVSNAFSNVKLSVYDTAKLDTIGNQYFSSLSDFWSSKWKPLLRGDWTSSAGSATGADWSPIFDGGFFDWSSQYKKDKMENKYELTWNKVDENVINPDFSQSFYQFSDNTKTSRNIINAMSINKAGTWIKMGAQSSIPEKADGSKTAEGWGDDVEGTSWRKAYIESHYLPTELNASVYDWTRGATSGGQYKIPTLGGLGPISSEKIYLQKKDFTYTFKDKDYTKEVTTMNDGFPLIFAKKDSELTWECVFSEVKGSTAVQDNGEVKVILSYGQFGDESVSKSGNFVQANGTKGTTAYTWTTSGKTCKIKWVMQEDAWIYAKWFPAALTTSNAKTAAAWSVTLNGEKSNKIRFIDLS